MVKDSESLESSEDMGNIQVDFVSSQKLRLFISLVAAS